MTTTPAEAMRHLTLEGAFNFRDLGGYETLDGRTVQWRRVFRADGPHALTDTDAQLLGALGLNTVIDLRTVDESQERGRWQDHVGDVMVHHLPMTDVLPDEVELRKWTEAVNVGNTYLRMAHMGAPAIGGAIAALAEPDALPAMFHCSAGKDRTGVLAAIVLGLLGVPDETIVADYTLSGAAMTRMLEWLRGRATDPEVLERFAPAVLSAEPVAMRVFLTGLRDEWGSFDAYAAALGLGSEVTALRATLLT